MQCRFDLAIKEYEGAKGGYRKGETCYERYLTNGDWQDFLKEMKEKFKGAFLQYSLGGGGELEEGRYPPKMACFGSSSRFIYLLSRNVCSFEFEKKLKTNIGEGQANLDGWLKAESNHIFVEAKCREPYGTNESSRSSLYVELLRYINERNLNVKWVENSIYTDKRGHGKIKCLFEYKGKRIEHFDLMQMICHMLGIGNGILQGEIETKPVKFLYLLYDPRKLTVDEKILKIYRSACLEENDFQNDYGQKLYGAVIDFLIQKQNVQNLTGKELDEIKKGFSYEAVNEEMYVERLKEYMETRYYTVSKIEGEYAYIKDCKSGEEVFIAMFLLPEGIDIGTKLKYEMLQYEIID